MKVNPTAALFAVLFFVLLLPFSAFATTETFTSSTTWTAPANVTTVSVQAWGGGGGGVNSGRPLGGGGGGGAYSAIDVTVIPGSNYTVTIGTGGGTSSAGGDTYFIDTTTVLAKGGGAASGSTGGTGGSSTTGVGTTRYSGGNGGNGNNFVGGGGGSSAGTDANGNNGANAASGGAGGTAPTGGGDGGAGEITGINPLSGSVPGGGGGGGSANSANGAAGKIILTYTATPATPAPGPSSSDDGSYNPLTDPSLPPAIPHLRTIVLPVSRILTASVPYADQLQRLTLRVPGHSYAFQPVGGFYQLKLPTSLPNNIPYTLTAYYGSTTRSEKGVLLAPLTLQSPLIVGLNASFNSVYHRLPTFSDWTYWANRLFKGEKTTLESLRGAMEWQQAHGK